MTQTDLRTIVYLGRMEGCTQRELAEAIEVTPITLGRQIDHLEEAGLIERRAHPQDRRATCLYLTARSRPRLDKVREISVEISALAMQKLSAAERTELLRLLQLVHATLLGHSAGQRADAEAALSAPPGP
jgi:DNA-binding MarR family transcriptional regulator